MSRKDYRKIAAIIRQTDMPATVRFSLVKQFIDWLEEDNPRFERNRFVDACSPEI